MIHTAAAAVAARTAACAGAVIEYPSALPISRHADALLDLWRRHQLIIVAGDTGSGKTTQLPKIAMQLGCGIAGRIGCTQPRRLAATAMARRLAQELKGEYGGIAGSQVRFEDHTSMETVLKFMTDGILLAEFRDDPLLRQYDCLIIDEAHERTLNIDFLLGLIKNLLPKRPDLKVAISSATLDTGRFSGFFDDAPLMEIAGRTFPVEDIFLPPLDDEELPEHVARAVEYLSGFDRRGDILVFLPGEREIRDCTGMLTGRNYPATEVLPLYARLSSADQQKVFHPGSKRRIILSTNVAETSLTIPRISFCIDSGLARVSRFNPRTRIQELQIEMISRASARQRRGRCGRTADGICVKLYSEADLEMAPEYTDPEIKRSSLAGVILQMAALRLPDIRNFDFIDPPKAQAVREGIRTLSDIGAINDLNRLTPDGRMLARIPLDPHLGKMLLTAPQLKVVPQLLILTAGLTVGEVKERPAEKCQAADEAHRRWKDERSDFISMLKLWNDLAVCDSNGILRKFCLRNYLSFRRVREWRNLVLDLADAIRYREPIGKVEFESYEQIHHAILSGIPRNIGFYDRENQIYRSTDARKFHLFPGSVLACKKRRPPEWVMIFHLVETSRIFGRTAAEITPQLPEKCAPHLCAKSYDQEHYDPASGFVRAREKLSLGGLIINAGRKVDFGRCNPAAAREIFIREALLPGLVDLPGSPVEKYNRIKEQLQLLELKMRRPGTIYDPEAAAAKFFAALPEEVNSISSLKNAIRNRRFSCNFDAPALMLEQFTAFDAGDYPDFLTFGGVKFPLVYRFAPGEADDGAVLMVRESMLNLLPANVLDYPVPGYFADFGEALMRSLPKEVRRTIGGIAEAAKRFADHLKNDLSAREMPPAEAMTEFLLYDSEIELNPRCFAPQRVPQYLKLKLGVLNDEGKFKELLTELPGNLHRDSRLSAALPGVSRHTAAKLTAFPADAGVMPESVEVPPGSRRLSYPALVDEGDSVAKQLFLKLPEAKRRHRRGIVRLFLLEHARQLKFLKRNLHFSNELRLSLMLNCSASEFENEVLSAALCAAAGCDLWEVRSAVDYAAAAEEMAMNWADETDALCAALERYTADCTAIRALARRAGKNGDAITDHLKSLFAPGFVRRPALLNDYPRYLRALKLRAERLINNPAKDAAKATGLTPYIERFTAAAATVEELTDSDGLYEFWELLEECRIAIFAPEVKCAVRSPLAKLEKAWEDLRI